MSLDKERQETRIETNKKKQKAQRNIKVPTLSLSLSFSRSHFRRVDSYQPLNKNPPEDSIFLPLTKKKTKKQKKQKQKEPSSPLHVLVVR